jgi:hypothetical protein
MNILIFGMLTLIIIIMLFAFSWGTSHEKDKQHDIQIQRVRDYLDHEIPNEWTAYKKGVHEGYDQGLRDGQEPPE